tara:strand:+ start:232 stop:645 length:414 start_codon:yes stop_codon:yes gene_type:complete
MDEGQVWRRHKGRMRKLISGDVQPTSKNETGFLEFVTGDRPAETIYEKAWRRFAKKNSNKPNNESSANGYLLSEPIRYPMSIFSGNTGETSRLARTSMTSKQGPSEEGTLKTCRRCHGDGGVNGGCVPCGGSGWTNF